jgi:hypothetical protein
MNLEQKYETVNITLPSLIIYNKVLVVEKKWYWHYKQIYSPKEQNGDPEINLCICSQLIFDKAARKYSLKWTIYSINIVEENILPYAKK